MGMKMNIAVKIEVKMKSILCEMNVDEYKDALDIIYVYECHYT